MTVFLYFVIVLDLVVWWLFVIVVHFVHVAPGALAVVVVLSLPCNS